MGRYILWRLALLPVVALTVFTLVFFIARATPGGPWDPDLPVSEAVRQNLRAHYGADEPLLSQYWESLRKLVLDGDLGPSYREARRDVGTLIIEALPISLQLGLAAMLLASVVGVCLGVFAARHQGTKFDYGAMTFVLVGISVPPYVTAPLLVVLFSIMLPWLPASGWHGLVHQGAIIPVVVLMLSPAANIARYTRNTYLDMARQDWVLAAEARGLPSRSVAVRYVLLNATIPVVTVGGAELARVVTGAFFVEFIYGIPGMGRLLIDAILARDYPVVMGVSLVIATLIVVINLVLDIVYAAVDPRVSYD